MIDLTHQEAANFLENAISAEEPISNAQRSVVFGAGAKLGGFVLVSDGITGACKLGMTEI